MKKHKSTYTDYFRCSDGYRVTLLVLFCFFAFGFQQAKSEVWSYNFGTTESSLIGSKKNSTSFFPNTPANGGTYNVQTASAATMYVKLVNNADPAGTGVQFSMNSQTGTSSPSQLFGITGWATPTTAAYLKCKLTTTATADGNLSVILGSSSIGTQGGNSTQKYSNAIAFLQIQYTAGAISLVQKRKGSAFEAITSHGLLQNTAQSIEIYANNAATATDYGRQGVNYTLPAKTWDLWVEGVQILSNAFTSGLAAGNALAGIAFYAESSTDMGALLSVDDVEYSNALPALATAIDATMVKTAYSIDNHTVRINECTELAVFDTEGKMLKKIPKTTVGQCFQLPTGTYILHCNSGNFKITIP